MILAWRLAWRDLRGGGRALWLLAVCLFLGTAALAGIGSLSASLLAALDEQGRGALGGDLELRVSQRRATIEERAAFASAGRVSESVTMRAMAEASGRPPTLVTLKGVDARWPLVGRFRLAIGRRPTGQSVAIAPALADRLALRPGDRVRLGKAWLRISGIVAEEPDQLGEGFRLGPPVIVDLTGLDATDLVQPGSLYESRYRLILPRGGDARAIGERLQRRFAGAGWSYRTAADAANGLRRTIAELGQFLLLVGLAALVIAGIGIASGVASYLDGKMRAIAVLKVIGARSRTIATMFLLELGIVAALAIGIGAAVGAAVPAIVATVGRDALPLMPRVALYPRPLSVAVALGLLVGLLSSWPALARARLVPAASLLRDTLERGRPSRSTLLIVVALATAIAALAVLSASDRKLAAGFAGATIAAIGVLAALGWSIRRGAALLPRPRSPLLRLALGNLHRPGAQTGRLVVALGLGFSLFVALAAIDTSLARQLVASVPAKAPRFFAIDLQPEDEARFGTAVRRASPNARIETAPSLRGSVAALNDVAISDMKPPPRSWVLRGDRTITWSATLPPHNRVIAGRWWPADYRGPPLVSIGDDMAQALGLKPGDGMTVSVLGVDVPARIAAIRTIDWSAMGLNFAIIFSPGYIEEAPHGLLASVYSAPGRDGAVAGAIAAALPSVTLMRVGDVIAQIGDVLGSIVVAIRAAAAVTVVAGVAVLIGAVTAAARAQRQDAVILKLLGATRRQLLAVRTLEYALLGAILGAVALVIGGAGGWYLTAAVFAMPFRPDWRVVGATIGAAIAVTLIAGLLGSLPILGLRTAAALRKE